jgi:hypothetical protein
MPSMPKYAPGTPNFTGYTNADFNVVPKSLLEEIQAQQKATQEAQIREAQARDAQRQSQAQAELEAAIQGDPNFTVDKLPDLLAKSGNLKYGLAALDYQNKKADDDRAMKAQQMAKAYQAIQMGDVETGNQMLAAMGEPTLDASVLGQQVVSTGMGGFGVYNKYTGEYQEKAPPRDPTPRQPQAPVLATRPDGTQVMVDPITGNEIPGWGGGAIRGGNATDAAIAAKIRGASAPTGSGPVTKTEDMTPEAFNRTLELLGLKNKTEGRNLGFATRAK